MPDNEQKRKDYAPSDLTEKQRNDLLNMNISEDYNTISRDLDKFHAIFYQIWEMGSPRFTFDIPTAAVSFDKKGRRIDFLFNPIFWKECDTYTKEFIICHECLHVILNHGIRIKDLKKNYYWRTLANKALDIVINHMLVDKFNFDRYSVKNYKNLCWVDTIFGKDHKKVERNRAFEYYFGLLKEKTMEDLKSGKIKIVFCDGSSSDLGGGDGDIHDFLDGFDSESFKKEMEDHINENLNDKDKKDFIDKLNETGEGKEENQSKTKGTIASGITFKMNIHEKVKIKRKWETVIQKWSMKFINEDCNVEQWAKLNRRMFKLPTNLILPSEVDDDTSTNDRIEVWFFQDVSGSCVHLKDRFFRAARSLPEDKFLVRAFSFDTEVHEVDLKKGEIIGGGGTSFCILEHRIQSEIKKNQKKKYPEAVFIVTDGYGDKVYPQIPRNWYWFLSENNRTCIPKECNIFNLKDFE